MKFFGNISREYLVFTIATRGKRSERSLDFDNFKIVNLKKKEKKTTKPKGEKRLKREGKGVG